MVRDQLLLALSIKGKFILYQAFIALLLLQLLQKVLCLDVLSHLLKMTNSPLTVLFQDISIHGLAYWLSIEDLKESQSLSSLSFRFKLLELLLKGWGLQTFLKLTSLLCHEGLRWSKVLDSWPHNAFHLLSIMVRSQYLWGCNRSVIVSRHPSVPEHQRLLWRCASFITDGIPITCETILKRRIMACSMMIKSVWT